MAEKADERQQEEWKKGFVEALWREGVRRIYQPPYLPEVNLVEGVFEEVRRVVEGKRWGRIEAKQAAVEAV